MRIGDRVRLAAKAQRFTTFAFWVVPAAAFLFSGISKTLNPSADGPAMVGALLGITNFSRTFQALGVAEIALGCLLIVPASRRYAAVAASALLFCFATLIAADVADGRFFARCGCFGASEQADPAEYDDPAAPLLARNFALLVPSLLTARVRPRSHVRREDWIFATSIASIALLGLLFVHERGEKKIALANASAARLGQGFLFHPGAPLPDIALINQTGKTSTVKREMRDGDRIVVFSRECPHCRKASASWTGERTILDSQGRRLVLLSVPDSRIEVQAFLQEAGLDGVVCYLCATTADMCRLGITAVPQTIDVSAGLSARFIARPESRPPTR